MRGIIQERAADLIRAAAKDVINMADDIAGSNTGSLCNIDVWIRIREDEIPKIEVQRTHASRECYNILAGKQN